MSESVTSNPPWLIFDLECVVTSLPDARVEALAEASGLDPVEVQDRLWASGFVAHCCLGEVSLAEMIAGIRERLAVDLTEAHLMGLWSLAYEPDLDAIAEIAATTGCQLGVVADETPLFLAAFEPYLPEVEMLTDCSWFSYELGALRNNQEFYLSLAQRSELNGEMPIFVAATATTSQVAAAAGWRVVPDFRSALRGDHKSSSRPR